MTAQFNLKKSEALALVPKDWDRSGLPAWAYTSEDVFELEKNVLFRRHWQVAGHISNVPNPGDYFCLDLVGERALIVRGKDGQIRAFHNVCRHRGSRVVADEHGTCGSALVCPFHGWSFNLDGTFRTAPAPRSFPKLDPVEHGLKPLQIEIWHGFIFIRFVESDQPSIAQLMARHEAEIAPYRVEDQVPVGHLWTETIDVNWKAVRDVDNEGYHVPMAHPALQDLYGKNYFDEPFCDGTSRSFAQFDEESARLWSVRHYQSILPVVEHLPESHRRAWLYIGLFPNAVLVFYPDSVGFYQEFPVSPGKTLQRACEYALPGESREMRLSRYLGNRINRDTVEEDIQLTKWTYEAAESSGYDGIILSDLEYGVKSFHDQLRRLMPVLGEKTMPAPGTLAAVNAELTTNKGLKY
jgi:phenylpropionate dioxygenase-like ring-hydroxylating dioxygenase large terminal subunit